MGRANCSEVRLDYRGRGGVASFTTPHRGAHVVGFPTLYVDAVFLAAVHFFPR